MTCPLCTFLRNEMFAEMAGVGRKEHCICRTLILVSFQILTVMLFVCYSYKMFYTPNPI